MSFCMAAFTERRGTGGCQYGPGSQYEWKRRRRNVRGRRSGRGYARSGDGESVRRAEPVRRPESIRAGHGTASRRRVPARRVSAAHVRAPGSRNSAVRLGLRRLRAGEPGGHPVLRRLRHEKARAGTSRPVSLDLRRLRAGEPGGYAVLRRLRRQKAGVRGSLRFCRVLSAGRKACADQKDKKG